MHRNPDSLRGADVAFYSYARLLKGELADAYPDLAPELIIEVLSPDDRWIKVLRKVTEYLEAGVIVVAVADPDSRSLHVYMADRAARILADSDSFSCPDVLGDFQCRVGEFFDD